MFLFQGRSLEIIAGQRRRPIVRILDVTWRFEEKLREYKAADVNSLDLWFNF